MSLSRAALVLLIVLAGCNRPKKNREACERWLDSLECGELDLGESFGEGFCDAYEIADCDFVAYFDCLAEESECDEESGIYTPAADCPEPDCDLPSGPITLETDTDTDADADSDTDSDTDADADADADSDADADTDTEVVTTCSGLLCVTFDGAVFRALHEIGVTTCPQPLGPIEVDNGTGDPALATFEGPLVQPLYVPGVLFDVGRGLHEPFLQQPIPPGASFAADAFFSCYVTSSFTADITVSVTAGAEQVDVLVPIDITVQ